MFTATLSTLAPSLAVPYGTVQFQIDGAPFGGPVTLSDGIAVSGCISDLSHGYHTNEADYVGDTNILGGADTVIVFNQHATGGGNRFFQPTGKYEPEHLHCGFADQRHGCRWRPIKSCGGEQHEQQWWNHHHQRHVCHLYTVPDQRLFAGFIQLQRGGRLRGDEFKPCAHRRHTARP